MRIVSLLPAATEILIALGLGPEVVGVTSLCDIGDLDPDEGLAVVADPRTLVTVLALSIGAWIMSTLAIAAAGRSIGVELPISVDLVVRETEPGFAGDTQTGARKPATMETGLVVQVPIFVAEGDTIRIDTRTGEYQTRV